MKVEFTTNARARMQDRAIREDDVRAALDAPDHLAPSFDKCWHARRRMEGRTLEVVFSRQRAAAQVITTYWQDASP